MRRVIVLYMLLLSSVVLHNGQRPACSLLVDVR
jgi:hypothetical protein